MIPLLAPLLFRGAGGVFGGGGGICGLFCSGICAIFAMCCCLKCLRCRCRDCSCCKRCLRATGHDAFDDFELVVLVNEAKYDAKQTKLKTAVRIRAGPHEVKTDDNGDGFFDQPLHIQVEQGTTDLVLDLMNGGTILATQTLDIAKDIINSEDKSLDRVLRMTSKSTKISNVRVKVQMTVFDEGALERGANRAGVGMEVDDTTAMLVERQLQKVEGGDSLSSAELLMQACAGPLKMFQQFNLAIGHKKDVYCASYKHSKHWYFGIWNDKNDCDWVNFKEPWRKIDLLRVQSVQRDPNRPEIFLLHYFDESRVHQILMFKRVDRNRDVWVTLLHDLVETARADREQHKALRGPSKTKKR